jgi:hypothetical protein
MSDDRKLKRRLFGYSKRATREVLAQHEALVRAAEERAEAVEGRLAALEGTLSVTRDGPDLHGRQRQSASLLNEELDSILMAAEQAAARIVDRASIASEEELARARKLWHAVQDESARLLSWQTEFGRLARQAATSLGEATAAIGQVPDRIREAVAPVAEAVSSMESDVSDLIDASKPPTLSSLEWDGNPLESDAS